MSNGSGKGGHAQQTKGQSKPKGGKKGTSK